MTTIITRLYPDLATAKGVASALASANGHPRPSTSSRGRRGATERMLEARVPAPSAAAYAPGRQRRGAGGGAGALCADRHRARRDPVVNRTPAIDVGMADEDFYIREQPKVET
jgi:hypothetical protein